MLRGPGRPRDRNEWRPEPRIARKLVRSWFIQGIGWYARDEVLARVGVEAAFVLGLLLSGWPPWTVAVTWVGFHTALWFLLYGGFLRAWIVFGVATDVDGLHGYLNRISAALQRRSSIRVAFLRGSGARDELGPQSDLDVCLVPHDRASARARGIGFLWSLRLSSVFHRRPVEARWIDYEKYIPYHIIGEAPRYLKDSPRETSEQRFSRRGFLVTFSGIDGSGKTSAARAVLDAFVARSLDAVYFYGHRQPWFRSKTGYQLSLAIVFESLWKRIGRNLPDLREFSFPRIVYDFATIVDYIYVRHRLSQTMRTGRIVLADRYIADVLDYLRSWGPLPSTLEGMLVGIASSPDVAFLFEIKPEEALNRKVEWDLQQLRIFVQEYSNLTPLLSLRILKAERPRQQIVDEVVGVLDRELRLPA
jgi:thymidylate kinase/predicted nucleotidyltransferase